MNAPTASTESAARLIYKALQTAANPVNDDAYRSLLALYRANPEFAADVQAIATGMEVSILDVSERGMVLVASSRDSRFAVRLTDIRGGLTAGQKATVLLAHVAIAAVFYPTTDGLDDDSFTPPPAALAAFRDTLLAMAKRFSESSSSSADIPTELAPAWDYLAGLSVAIPSSQRATTNSLEGTIKMTLTKMLEGGLIRVDRQSDEDTTTTYTATHRLRIQVRELALRRLFELAQQAAMETKTAL